MPPSSLTAARVVARHVHGAIVLRDLPATVDVIYSDGGIVSAADVARLLEDRLGTLLNVRFRPTPSGTSNSVRWEALDDQGEIVTGQLVLHAGLRDNRVVVWAEIVIGDEHGARTAGGTPAGWEKSRKATIRSMSALPRTTVPAPAPAMR